MPTLSNEILEPYIVGKKPLNFEEECFANFPNIDENNNYPVCDLNSFTMSVEEEQLLISLEELNVIDIIENEGLVYIAGYAAYRFKNKYPYLSNMTCLLPATTNVDWLQFISRGKCMYPSEELLTTARVMNIEFMKYHESSLSKDEFIFKTLAEKIEIKIHPIKIPKEVILCLVRTRTYIRVREINRQISLENRKKNNKKKMLKFINN